MDEVEDVVAEIFMTMVEQIDELRADTEAGFFAWLFRITKVKVAVKLKAIVQHGHRNLALLHGSEDDDLWEGPELADADLTSDPVAAQEWSETLGELGTALDDLTSEQRFVISQRFLQGRAIDDIARSMRKQPAAIRQLQFRALEQLAKSLGRIRERPEGKRGLRR
jgi:RNA polymerase sigma factor (sigma-70 family)